MKRGVRHAHTLPVFAGAKKDLSPTHELSTGHSPNWGALSWLDKARSARIKLADGLGGVEPAFDETTLSLSDWVSAEFRLEMAGMA